MPDHSRDRSLTVTDNRTGNTVTVPLDDGCLRATDLRQVKESADDSGLMSYDPGFMNTACCRSSITYIDGDRGILRYRGYPIDELAEKCTHLEVAYLLLWGELPSESELREWESEVMRHSAVDDGLARMLDGFAPGAHPMAMLIAASASLAGIYPDARSINDPANRRLQIARLIAKMPSMAAAIHRRRAGLGLIAADTSASYAGNFLSMMGLAPEADPVLARALDILFILHADHEQNCSTSAMRTVASAGADPYSAAAAAIAALSGPLHGGANEQVLHMLDEIGSKDNVRAYVDSVKAGKGRLMGFGHRIYKNYDPRASIVKRTADQVFEVTGRNPKIEIARELERIALEDEYFIRRKLYPNVDFYSGIIYEAMGFPPEMFTVLFAIGRTPGWLAQWEELMSDPERRIARPRQLYTSPAAV
jgi:citrate synthase